MYLQSEDFRAVLSGAELVSREGIPEDAYPRPVGKRLPQQLCLLFRQFGLAQKHPGHIAVGPRQALHIALCEWVVVRRNHDDRQRARRAERRLQGWLGSLRDEYVYVRSHEFGRVGGQRAQILLHAPKVHDQVLAILEAVDLQLVDEGLVKRGAKRYAAIGAEKADARDPVGRLLRARRERPRRRSAAE